MKCQGCGADLLDYQLFCPNCGAKNESAGVPVQPVETQNVQAINQMPPYQTPTEQQPGQMPPYRMQGQMPPVQHNQVPPYQIPQNQGQQYQMQQNQTPSYQMPPQPGQMSSQPGQMPPQSGQMPPYRMQGQMPPVQGPVPPYQHQGQMPPQPGQMPPYQAPYPQQKKKGILPVIIIVGVLAVLLIGGIAAVTIIRQINRNKEKALLEQGSDIIDEFIEDYPDIFITPDDTVTDIPSFDDDSVTDDPSVGDDTAGNTDTDEFNFVYNYLELPNTASIDGDPRFTYYDYSSDSGMVIYTYYFNDTFATDDEFIQAVEQYCLVLTNWHDYSYEDAISTQMFDPTDLYSVYYSVGTTYIGITARSDSTGRYAYISIFDSSYLENGSVAFASGDNPNYFDYLYGRDMIAFNQYGLVMMENGINYYMNDIYLTDNGDGTARIECALDLQTNFYSSDLYSDDFMIVPYDAYGNILADATKINAVTDSYGNNLSTPVVLTSDYISYNLSFTVPSDTSDIVFYGVNIQLDEYSDSGASVAGPVYYIEITFQTR